MAAKQIGKGGSWDSRPNPFGRSNDRAIAPELGGVSGLGNAFDKVLRTGCAVMVGLTRDGGAVVLTILDGDQRHRTYCSNPADLDAAVEAMSFVYDEQ